MSAMHYDETAIDLAREMLIITLKIAAPMLAAGVVVGLVVSLFQSVTSIQDQTLISSTWMCRVSMATSCVR